MLRMIADSRATESLTVTNSRATESLTATDSRVTESPTATNSRATESLTATDSRATESLTATDSRVTESPTATEETIPEMTAGIQSLHSRQLRHSLLSTLQISRQTHLPQSTSRVRLYREASRSQSTLIQGAVM